MKTATEVGFPGLEGAKEKHAAGWDWTPYRGPLRAILAKHRGVEDI